MQSVGGTAAPLLAGFSMSVMASIINSGEHYRWPGQTLLLLAAAVVLFVACLQNTFWARQYSAHPSEITPWWLDFEDPERRKTVIDEQHGLRQIHDLWAKRARWTYSSALLLLLLGLASALAPARTSPAPLLRWAASGLVLAASLYEVVWIAVALPPDRILAAAPRPPANTFAVGCASYRRTSASAHRPKSALHLMMERR